MARIRSLKPEMWMSPQVMNLSHSARLLFIGLITQADDEGRGTADPRRLKAAIFGGDDITSTDVRRMLVECSEQGLVSTYEAENHGVLYSLPTWRRHQSLDRPRKSTYPNPPESTQPRRALDVDASSPREGSKGIETKGNDGELVVLELNGHPADSPTDVVIRVFEHWRGTWDHPRAQLDSKRRKVIRAALDLYSEADLITAISGYRNSDHHMGKNERKTVFDDVELLLRDAKHIDAGLAFAKQGSENGKWM